MSSILALATLINLSWTFLPVSECQSLRLMDANQTVYDKLTLGITVTEFVGDKKAQPTIQ